MQNARTRFISTVLHRNLRTVAWKIERMIGREARRSPREREKHREEKRINILEVRRCSPCVRPAR